MQESDVILTPLFQADVDIKYRPAIVPQQLVRGTLGTISKERHIRLLQKLVSYFTDSTTN